MRGGREMLMRMPSRRFGRYVSLLLLIAIGAVTAHSDRAHSQTIEETVSESGIRAWLVVSHDTEIVSLRFAFLGGSAQEPDDKAGVSELLSALLIEGAGDFDAIAFKNKLVDQSTRLSFIANRDAFFGSLDLLAQNRESAPNLLALAIERPQLTDDAVLQARDLLLERLGNDAKDQRAIAESTWYGAVFGRHPYARDPAGSLRSVSSIEAADIAEHRKRLFAKSNLRIVAVGAITAAELGQLLDGVFGRLPDRPALPTLAQVLPMPAGTIETDMRQASGTTIVFGAPSFPRTHPDYAATLVANRVLGGNQLDSRLSTAIRSQHGLAYSAVTSLISDSMASVLFGEIDTDNAHARQAVAILRAELQRLAEKGVNQAELDAAKSYLTGSFAISLDSNAAMAEALLTSQLDGLQIQDVKARNRRIEAVSVEDVRRVATSLLDARVLTFAIVGNPRRQSD